jgi:oligopeptide transport system ATP-binding protein
MNPPLLSLENLTVTVAGTGGEKVLVDRISLEVPAFSITALVGGSGSGKTTTGLSILRLLPPALRVKEGEIVFNQDQLFHVPPQRMRHLRGKEIGMVFQEPLHALNPVFCVGSQIEEVMRYHTALNRRQRQQRILDLMDQVGLPDPPRVSRSYPHQLSGGMRQRVMIAQAIAGGPRLIIADEPTSSLDVTLQARIIDLFLRLKEELRLSILLITHDLGMVAHMADSVAVLREGKIVEAGKTKDVLGDPQHPYTRQLMEAMGV